MANDPKIRIPIELPAGDQSGVEQAKKGIEEVKQAAEAAEDPALVRQRIEDVAAARKIASERRIEEQEKELAKEKELQQAAQDSARLRIAAGAALAASARQIAAQTVDVIKQYRELGVELGGFESIGLEFAEFLTRPFEYVTDAFTGYKEELKLLAEGQREVARAEAVYQDTLRAKQAETRAANEAYVSGALARELAALNQINAAYERRVKTLADVVRAEESLVRLKEEISLTDGTTDPETVAANRASRAAAARADQSAGLVTEAERGLDKAIADRDALVSALVKANATLGPLSEEAKALSEEARVADEAIEEAKAELAATREQQRAAIVSLIAESLEGTLAATRDAQDEVAARAAEVVATVEAGGRELSAAQLAARDRITTVLADQRVTAEEQQGLTNDLQIMMQGFRGTTEEQRKVTQEFIEIVKLGNANTAEVARQQAQLRRDVDQIRLEIQERN